MLFIKSVNIELLQATVELENLLYVTLQTLENSLGALRNEPLSQQATCYLSHHIKRCILCCYILDLFKKKKKKTNDFFS